MLRPLVRRAAIVRACDLVRRPVISAASFMPRRKLLGRLLLNQRIRCHVIACLTIAGCVTCSRANAANYYWTGDSPSGAAWNSTIGGTNWSTDPNTLSDPGQAPGAGDDVFFVFSPENNAGATTLGANFSIKGLTFTADATGAVVIGGNQLTLGTDGITVNSGSASNTINSAVVVGGVEAWANDAVAATTLTFGGQILGSSALTLEGSGSTATPSGSFIFTAANTYSGAVTLLNANTSLTLSGSGTLGSATSIALGGGSSLTLSDTSNNIARLGSTVAINSNGGTINLIGSGGGPSADSTGTLTLNTGETAVNVTPGSLQTATLTINSLNRQFTFTKNVTTNTGVSGASVNFSTTGTMALTSSSTPSGILGGWATIGNLNSNTGSGPGSGALDWATVSSGNVLALPIASYTNGGSSFTPWTATANIYVNTTTLSAGANESANTIYLYGASPVISGNGSTHTITVTSGGVIADSTTGTATFSGGITVTGVADLGSSMIGNSSGSFLTSSAPDLVFNVAGSIAGPTNPTGTNNGYLQVAGVIKDNGTSSVGVTKNGGGILDLSALNNGTVPAPNTYTGPVTINGGAVAIGGDTQLGAVPTANTSSAVVLNGGELRMLETLTLSSLRGMTVGPQGGTISYVGGNTTELSSFQVNGSGSLTFADMPGFQSSASNMGAAMSLNYTTGSMTYSGGTTLYTLGASNFSGIAPYSAVEFFTISNEFPSTSPVTITDGDATTQHGLVNLNGTSQTWGSLAGNGDIVTDLTATQTLTVGGNNLSTTYSGNLGHSGLSWGVGTTGSAGTPPVSSGDHSASGNVPSGVSGTNIALVKNGSGILTFSAAAGSNYSGGTTINNGAIRVANASGSATGSGPVTIGGTSVLVNGNLGGAGIVTGLVTVNQFGQVSPTLTGTGATTLQLTGGLTLNDGAILNFNLGAVNSGPNPIASPASDNIYLGSGALSIANGTDTINVSSVGAGLTPNTYHLISTTGTVPANLSGVTFNVNGPLQDLYQVQLNSAGGTNTLDLVVTTNPNPSLTWVGAPGNGSWDTNPSNQPWTFTGQSGSAAYSDGAQLTFDNTPGTNSAISIPANVAPGSLTFNNNASNNFTFSGAGQITGTIGFTKKNTGTVEFDNTNTFNGAALIQGGGVIVGATGALANTSYAVSSSASLTVNGSLSGTPTLANAGSTTFSSASQTLTSISGAGSLTLNGTALTVSNASSYNGAISGTGSLSITSGTLTLSTANTYTGGTTAGNGATISVASDANLGTPPASPATNITLNGGTLQVTAGTATPNATIAANRSMTLGAAGGTINVAFAATGSFNMNAETALIYTGAISGGSGVNGLTVTGGSGANGTANPYLLELGPSNSYSGPGIITTIDNATVGFLNNFGGGFANALPTSTVLNLVNNGWFDMNNGAANQTIAGLIGDATGLVGSTNTVTTTTLTITPATGLTYTFPGVIGPVSLLDKTGLNNRTALTINGPGTQILTGTNTYAGATMISQGTLQIGSGGPTGSLAAASAITDNGTLRINRSNTATQGTDFAGGIGGSGDLVQAGVGTLILNTANGYGGSTLVSAGTLQLSSAGSINGSSGITVSGSGAKFLQLSSVASTPSITLTQGTLDGTGSVGAVTVGAATGGIVANGNGSISPLTLNALAFNGGAAVALNAAGGSTIAPAIVVQNALTTPNTGAGEIAVNVTPLNPWNIGTTYDLIGYASYPSGILTDFANGTIAGLSSRETASLAIDSVNNAIAITINGDNPKWTGLDSTAWQVGTTGGNHNWQLQIATNTPTDYIEGDGVLFDDSATNAVTSGAVTLNTANVSPTSTTFNNSSIAYTLSGSFGITGSGPLVKNGTASVTINTINSYTGATFLNAGTLTLGGTLGSSGGTAITSAAAFTETGTGVVAGSSSLRVTGGTTTLAGTNSYSGPTTLQAGVLNLNNAAALGTSTLTISGGTIDNTSSGSITLNSNPQVWSGNFAFGGTQNLNIGMGAVTMNANIAITLNNGANLTAGGVIGGNFGLSVGGVGTLTPSNANTFTGGVTINNGATVSISAGNNLGAAPAMPTTNITLNGGTLQLTVGTADPTATINPNRSMTLGAGGGTINVAAVGTGNFAGNTETAVIYTGTISGGNLSVTGPTPGNGTNSNANPYLLELGATNNYTGTTTINNATVSFLNSGGGFSNTLPVTTVLTLQNYALFLMNNGAANQTIAGLNGEATTGIGGMNTATLTTLTITPAVGQTYIYSGVIGAQTILNKTGANTETALTINGPGTQVLVGTNTYTGATLISQGVLQLGNGSTTGSLAPASAITDNGTLAFNRSNIVAEGTDFAATIGGSGSLVQAGGSGSTLILNAANSYGGGTILTSGTLRIANGASGSATGGGSVLLNGGTLAGATGAGGSIAGLVSVGSAAHVIAPGAGLTPPNYGTLTLNGGLTTSSLTTLTFNLGTSTTGGTGSNELPFYSFGDRLNVNGAGLTLNGNPLFTFGANPTAPGDYEIIGGSFGTPNLNNAAFTNVPVNTQYALMSGLGDGFIDLVVTQNFTSVLKLPNSPITGFNVHVGDTSTTRTTTVTNSDTSSTGHFSATSTGTNGLTITLNNGNSVLPSNSTNFNVAWSSSAVATAGLVSGQITIANTDNANDTAAANPPKTQSVSGGVYNLAATGFSGATLNFADYHQGATAAAQTIAISNTAPATGGAGGYTEGLDASFGTPSAAGIQTSGSISDLYPEGGTSTAMSVGINTSTPGAYAGRVAVSLTSDGTGTSGLANTGLTPQTVTIAGGNDTYSGKAQWNIAGGGNWSTQNNWSDTQSSVQVGAPGISGFFGDTATFANTPATITLDVSPTLAAMSFNTASSGYTIAPSGSNRITLNTNGSGAAVITVTAGSHTISAPVTVALGGVNISGAGALALTSSGNAFNGPMAVTGSGTTTLSGGNAFNYASNSPPSISVGTGADTPKLVINPSSASTVAAGVTATVSVGATLELDGTNSALTDSTTPLQRAGVQNDGSLVVGAATAPTIGGTVQQVGGIDPYRGTTGSVIVSDGASLTADHINQASLVIGNGSVFTLAASDPSGNPMGSAGARSSLLLAGSLAPSSSFVATGEGLLTGGSTTSGVALSPSLGGVGGGRCGHAVLEPSTIGLLLLGCFAILPILRRKRKIADGRD